MSSGSGKQKENGKEAEKTAAEDSLGILCGRDLTVLPASWTG